MKRLSPVRRAAIAAATALLAVGAHAQNYPTKAVRVVVPFPPGSGADVTTRLVMPKLGENLGQQFVVDNRSGAAGHIGAEIAAKAPPDGYTLLSSPASIVISQSLYKKLSYNLERDFEPVAMMASAPFVLVVHPSLPVRTQKELIAFTKARPGQLTYASTGNGGSPHLAMEVFRQQAGIDIVHVPYKGTPPAVTDIIAGQVSMMFGNTLSVLPHIKSNRLRALSISSAKRSAAAPDIPTVAESGIPGYDAATWFGVFAPTGTSKDIIQKLNAEIRKVAQTPDVRDKLVGQGADPINMSVDEFRAFVKAELAKWAKAVKAANVTIE